ncbi:MAG: peptidoglycan DD-metalloendopeptidase family protein [Ruminococcus sp.]|uniref:peptidoglycan DD-metalloendopeptidase family protein n=1 Tax=Ruminococcus sp. TaxID=41978 RepID=UPI0025CC78AB|nr:peptidoglycan DD-metalloendopeptidase family protein [Ruminococcus sp.]MCR5600604.1 peptidoglycan DD-metalloendopeptidase family protein [Ruminococcus sp.]
MKNLFMRASAILLSIAFIFTVQLYIPSNIDAHAAVYAVWPAEPKYKNITTYFDPARNSNDNSGYHNAIDIEAAGGSNIYAACGGEVISADWKGDYGYLVILYHADLGVYTFYAHASQVLTSAGAKVKQGDTIAKVGSTGNSSGNHIHFGVCNTLVGGYPARTYYDPLTYFTYSDNNGENNNGAQIPNEKTPSCSCSDKYAGTYTTKNVVTYLNIRADHSTNSAVVGTIPANAVFTVTMGDGKWAHVEYNGVKGFASMDYMQLKEKNPEIKSDMKITGVTAPEGELELGKPFSIRGVITSALPIKKVYGGVYFRNGEATSQCVEAAPNTEKYDLSTFFDNNVIFGVLKSGEYTYKITAEDTSGTVYYLVTSEFTIAEDKPLLGDLNGDGVLNVSDAVILQNYLLKRTDDFSREQFMLTDMNGDGSVDVFDLVELKKAILNTAE